jgi:hypothetical protein
LLSFLFLCASFVDGITPYSNARERETDTEGGGGGGFAPSVSAITGVGKRPQICVKPHKEREKEICAGDVAQVF